MHTDADCTKIIILIFYLFTPVENKSDEQVLANKLKPLQLSNTNVAWLRIKGPLSQQPPTGSSPTQQLIGLQTPVQTRCLNECVQHALGVTSWAGQQRQIGHWDRKHLWQCYERPLIKRPNAQRAQTLSRSLSLCCPATVPNVQSKHCNCNTGR